jgi:hypothetical protein
LYNLYNMLYNMPEGWKLTEQETMYLSHLGFSISPAIPHIWAKWKPGLAAEADSAGRAAVAEIEEFTLEEILHALRTAYGAQPDPTRRLELLHDKDGRLPEYVSIQKAAEWCRVSKRRMQQLTEMENPRLRYVGGKGHRRILVADLIVYRTPEK